MLGNVLSKRSCYNELNTSWYLQSSSIKLRHNAVFVSQNEDTAQKIYCIGKIDIAV